jgi:allantoinase
MGRVAIVGQRVVTPDGVRPAAVLTRDGIIEAVRPSDENTSEYEVLDAGGAVVMPGVVDTHVHVNEPGRTEWEGFATATRAAAAGGVTTLLDMPLNCIPVTTTRAALDIKRQAIDGLLQIDCGFRGGLVPGNTAELEPMLDAGVVGFKAFLVHSGIDEFPEVREPDLRAAMAILARRGAPLLVHAELDCGAADTGAPTRYASYLASRPRQMENDAIRFLIGLCKETGCRVHVVHLSSSEALSDIAAARREGLPLTVETCPHYLHFAAEEIPDGKTQYKCAPPIRERENRELLWRALSEGVIDFVVSDHSPCTPHLKRLEAGDFMAAWGGISSLQLSLPVTWTEARAHGASLSDIARWMCERPAAFAGLGQKGALKPGRDADVVIWDPDATFTVEASRIHHRHKLTPYTGQVLNGVVQTVLLRGVPVYAHGGFVAASKGRGMTVTSRATP